MPHSHRLSRHRKVWHVAAATALDDQTPRTFRDAVASLRSWRPDEHVVISEITAPANIAPHSFALSAVAKRPGQSEATGKLVLLHDPQPQTSWRGNLRLVSFLRVNTDHSTDADQTLAVIAWSWLEDGLKLASAPHLALGGTVTCTADTRFGELRDPADGNVHATDVGLEVRASWTAPTTELTTHLWAWCLQLAAAVQLSPEAVGEPG